MASAAHDARIISGENDIETHNAFLFPTTIMYHTSDATWTYGDLPSPPVSFAALVFRISIGLFRPVLRNGSNHFFSSVSENQMLKPLNLPNSWISRCTVKPGFLYQMVNIINGSDSHCSNSKLHGLVQTTPSATYSPAA